MNKDSEEFKQGSNIIDLSTHKNNIRMPAPAAGGPPTVDKKKIKCVHWPNCRVTDDVCAYFHPKEECNKFPNCSFGDKCLYIHPDVSSLSLSYPYRLPANSATTALVKAVPINILRIKHPLWADTILACNKF